MTCPACTLPIRDYEAVTVEAAVNPMMPGRLAWTLIRHTDCPPDTGESAWPLPPAWDV